MSGMKQPLNDGRSAKILSSPAGGGEGQSWSLWDDTDPATEDGINFSFTMLSGGTCVNDEDGAAQAMGWLNGKGLL